MPARPLEEGCKMATTQDRRGERPGVRIIDPGWLRLVKFVPVGTSRIETHYVIRVEVTHLRPEQITEMTYTIGKGDEQYSGWSVDGSPPYYRMSLGILGSACPASWWPHRLRVHVHVDPGTVYHSSGRLFWRVQ
jgi:hypothetical protein